MKLGSKTLVAALLLSPSLAGCSLMTRSAVMPIHWYDAQAARPRLTSHTSRPCHDAGDVELALGRVSSGLGLRDRIAFRDGDFDVGYYDDRRWSERPDVYVRRALERALFEERCIERAMAGPGPTLDVEVLSFEELRSSPRAARVRLRVIVYDDRRTLLQRTITVVRPARADRPGFGGVVEATAEALDAAAAETARLTEAALRSVRTADEGDPSRRLSMFLARPPCVRVSARLYVSRCQRNRSRRRMIRSRSAWGRVTCNPKGAPRRGRRRRRPPRSTRAPRALPR